MEDIKKVKQTIINDLDELSKYRELGSVEQLAKRVNEEDCYKFYYCESEDEYMLGKRVDTSYYAQWYPDTGFIWGMSKNLPWGEPIRKDYKFPSEPVEMGQDEWFRGFLKKYFSV